MRHLKREDSLVGGKCPSLNKPSDGFPFFTILC